MFLQLLLDEIAVMTHSSPGVKIEVSFKAISPLGVPHSGWGPLLGALRLAYDKTVCAWMPQ